MHYTSLYLQTLQIFYTCLVIENIERGSLVTLYREIAQHSLNKSVTTSGVVPTPGITLSIAVSQIVYNI